MSEDIQDDEVEEEVNPPFELHTEQDSVTGLRSATLKVNTGFPKQYLGTYKFKEWTYGEKINVELDAENVRLIQIRELQAQLADNPDDVKLKGKLESLKVRNVDTYIILQTLTTLRSAPLELETIEQFNALPGRVGTLLSNVAGHIDLAPDEEKKG